MIPPSNNTKWKDLVTGKTQYQFNLLGLRILMGRILLSTRMDPSHSNVNQAVEEIRDFFVKNEKIATQDLNKIFG